MEIVNLANLANGTSNRDHGRSAGFKILANMQMMHIQGMSDHHEGKAMSEEEIHFYKNNIKLNLEIPKDLFTSTSFLDEIIRILAKNQFLDQVTFFIYDERTLSKLRAVSTNRNLEIHANMDGEDLIIKPSPKDPSEDYEVIHEDL